MNTRIPLYSTSLHDCSYLENKASRNLIIDPEVDLDPLLYEHLLELGFRRSGNQVYRPACPSCSECQSSRVNVRDFAANRSQRRAWKKLQDSLQVTPTPARFNEEYFALYKKYTASRHQDGEMQNSSADQFMAFLTASWSKTWFLELRLDNKLLAVAVTDHQPASLSALYTFFDPEQAKLSPGVVAILAQLQWAKQLGLNWLYLGFWIPGSSKMSYKTQYQPIEIFKNDCWQRLDGR